ncbi:hypothetical protein FOZ60_015052 [Perkinsus olseni]|uniref:Uncharacterized protein n=1 Tax=Perkinsus olseni TaxID=32597 RepID=A0A7J6N6A1_PEROL|nr:hypothetical protein FOZ60_015052 [Perkinsus olseni]
MGSLQRDGTRILSTLDPFIPLHINQPVERPLDVDGVTNTRYSLAYLRGVRVGISRSGPAENICGGTLCDGQLAEIAATRGCCCVGTPRQSCWAVSLVVQLTGDEFDEDMQLTSMRLTALFATPVAMRAPIEAVDTILLEDSVDEIVRRVNDDYGGWTLTIWSKSAQAVATEGVNTGGGIRPPRRHLVRMEPTAALTEEQQGVLDGLKYTGVARRNLGEGAGDNDDAAAGENGRQGQQGQQGQGQQGQQGQGHHHHNNNNDNDGDN